MAGVPWLFGTLIRALAMDRGVMGSIPGQRQGAWLQIPSLASVGIGAEGNQIMCLMLMFPSLSLTLLSPPPSSHILE